MSGMESGDVTVDVRADIGQYVPAMQQAGRETQRFVSQTQQAGRASSAAAQQVMAEAASLQRLQERVRATNAATAEMERATRASVSSLAMVGVRTAAVGIGLNLLGQNLASVSDDAGSATSRMGGFLQQFTQGNIVGAIKAAGASSQFTAEQIQKLALSFDAAKVAALAAVPGFQDAAAKIRAAYLEMTAAGSTAAQHPDSLGGPMGPGARAFESPSVTLPTGKLNLWRVQQTAKAAASPGLADDIREARKNIAYLQRLAKDTSIRGAPRTDLYQQIAQQRSALEALTKKTTPDLPPILPPVLEAQLAAAKATINKSSDDLAVLRRIERYLEDRLRVTKDIQRRTEMLQRLGQTRSDIQSLTSTSTVSIGSVVGGIGQGPWMGSELMQFARSFGYKPTASDYVKDAQQQARQAVSFINRLKRLGQRGLSQQAVGEIAQLGPEQGSDIASVLSRATSGQLRAINLAERARSTIAAATIQLQNATVAATNVTVTASTVSLTGKGSGGGKAGTNADWFVRNAWGGWR